MCKITDELQKPLDGRAVKSRTKGGATLSYVEGWHVIAEANRIFGFLGWDMVTQYCKQISAEKNAKGNHVVGYEAKVTITVRTEDGFAVQRDGIGFGSGIASSLFDAQEGAGKEAETDAMKRAFKSFGNPFGLALYDKSHANVDDEAAAREAKEQKAKDWIINFTQRLEAITTMEELVKAAEETADVRTRIAKGYPHLIAGVDAVLARNEMRLKEQESA